MHVGPLASTPTLSSPRSHEEIQQSAKAENKEWQKQDQSRVLVAVPEQNEVQALQPIKNKNHKNRKLSLFAEKPGKKRQRRNSLFHRVLKMNCLWLWWYFWWWKLRKFQWISTVSSRTKSSCFPWTGPSFPARKWILKAFATKKLGHCREEQRMSKI